MEEAGTFFKEPDKIKVWGDNVRLVTTRRDRRPDPGHGDRPGGRRQAARLPAAAGAGAGADACLLRPRIRRLALVLRPQHASLGRLYGEALHAHGIRRRQGGPVLHVFLSLLGLRPAVAVLCLPVAGHVVASSAAARGRGALRAS
jgi:hypothetical protein